MKQTVYLREFIEAFEQAGRGKQFTRGGLCLLFDMLEELEEDTGEELELDVIALCCQYGEYEAHEFIAEHNLHEDYRLWSEDNPPATPVDSVEETEEGHQGEYLRDYLHKNCITHRTDDVIFIIDTDSI